jgi:hypothetical protein
MGNGLAYSKTNNLNSASSKNIPLSTVKNPISKPNQEYYSSFNIRLFGGRRESDGNNAVNFSTYKSPTENHLGVKYYKNDQVPGGVRYNYPSGLAPNKYTQNSKIDLYARLNNRVGSIGQIRDASLGFN